jgi:mxaJ protein
MRARAFATLLVGAVALAGCARAEAEVATRQLRVCSDPNNLPFSNRAEEGMENRIAEIIAEELGAELTYEWFPQWRTFLRNTLRADKCDVVMGVPSSYELVLPTAPYYRSTYVFVYRADSGIELRSMDDEALRHLIVGAHLIGDDYANTPPIHALGNRGIIHNVKGYMIYGDYNEPNPPSRILDALVDGEIDVAIVWGPLAGYFAPRKGVPLEMVPVTPQIDLPFLPFVYDISLGVRRGEEEWRDELDGVLERRRDDIQAVLDSYGVPQVRRQRRGS